MKLADIAFVTRRSYKGSICVSPDEFDLLVRAVRQLGPFAKHAQHHISCETFDTLECSCDLDNQLAGIDPDVLELIAEGARK